MRSTIKAVFPDRDVATMVRPALSESDLQQLNALPYERLRPEFRRVSEQQGGWRHAGVVHASGMCAACAEAC
jgi:hypothetical protein